MFSDRLHIKTATPLLETDCVEIRSADQLVRPELRKLFEFWRSKAGIRPAPMRSEIEVAELRQWLPHILLSDLLEGEADIRFRVIGTWVTEQFGRDDTGRTFEEIGWNDRTRTLFEVYSRAAGTLVPQRSSGSFFSHTGTKDFLLAERLILPLSDDGRRCNKILSAIYFLNAGL